MLHNFDFEFSFLLPSDSLFLTCLLHEDPEGVLVLARLLLLSITRLVPLTRWSQYWCHWHVYTALIITLMSHFNSSSVNWTASGFSRSSLLLWQLLPGGCCPLAPAHGPLTAGSRRKMPDCDPASYRIRVRVMCDVQWWVLVRCHHVMCPARSQMSNMSIFAILTFQFSWHWANFQWLILQCYHSLLLYFSLLDKFKYYHFNKQDGKQANCQKLRFFSIHEISMLSC